MRFEKNTKIYLYKTPLDEKYRNVYDDYNDELAYHTFLLNFPHIEIDVENLKSSRDTNGRFSVDVANYNSMDLHDYNYMEFMCNNERKFAFIMGLQSQNDAPAPSCQLSCKLDAWANHYQIIKNSFNSVFSNRATFDTHIKKNIASVVKNGKYAVKKIPSKFAQSDGPMVVLWQRLIISDSPTITRGDVTYGPYQFTDLRLGGTYVLYKPVGLLSIEEVNYEKTLVFLPNAIHVGGTDYNDNVNKLLAATPAGELFSIANCISSFIISNTLCYSVPFKYAITLTGQTYVVDIDSSIKFAFGNDIKVGTTDIVHNATFIMPVDGAIVADVKTDISLNYASITVYDRYSTNYVHACETEGIFAEYPFNYYSIYIGNEEVRLIPISGASNAFTLSYDCSGKINPDIRIYSESNNPLHRAVLTSGQLDTRNLAYDEYMARNANSIETERDKIYFNMLSQFASGALMAAGGVPPVAQIGGIINAGFQLQSIESRLEDFRNTPSTVAATVDYPTDNPFSLDLILICENSIHTISSALMQILGDYHYNGYEANLITDITTKSKDCFDVVEGELTLNAQMSIDDRNEIITAVSNRMTRWHIGTDASNARINVLKTMNKNVSNYNVSQIR